MTGNTPHFAPGHTDRNAPVIGAGPQPKEMDLTVKPEGWGSWFTKKITGGIGAATSAVANTSAGKAVTAKVKQAGNAIINNSTVQSAIVSVAATLLKSDPKVLKESQLALEKLGLTGPKSVGIKVLIDDAIKKQLDSPDASPQLKQLIESSKENVTVIKDTVETIVTAAIANLARILEKKALIQGHAYAPASFSELMQDVLSHFAEGAHNHFIGVNRACTMREQIAKIESSLLSPEAKLEKLTELFAPLTQDMIKAAFPKGLGGAGLGWIAGPVGNYALGYLPGVLAKYYAKAMEPVAESEKRKTELNSSKEGQLLLQTAKFAADAVLKLHPAVQKLGAFGAPILESLVTKLACSLAGGDKVTPLQSALKKLSDIFANFYLSCAAKLKASYQTQIKLQLELAACKASSVSTDPVQAKARSADIERLEKLIEDEKSGRLLLVKPLANNVWTAFGLENERLVNTLLDADAKKKLIEETIPKELLKVCDAQLLANPGILHWIAPDQAVMQAEIDRLKLGDAVAPLAQAFSQLILSPASAALESMSETIAAGVVAPVHSTLPLLSADIQTHIKTSITAKLQEIATKPKSSDPLWLFLQANLQGIALDVVKSLAGNKNQAELIRSIGALPSGGRLQDVISLLKTIAADFKGDVEAFHKEHGLAIAAARSGLPSNPQPADTKKFHDLFQPLRDTLLQKTGLDALLAKDGRLNLFGLDQIIKQQLLGVCIEIYSQSTQSKAAAPASAPVMQNPAPASVPGLPAINQKEMMDLLSHAAEVIGRHFNGLGDPTHPTVSLPERIAAIENNPNIDDAAKKKEIADLFKPLVQELNKDKNVADFLMPLVQSLIAAKSPAGMQSMLSAVTGAFGNTFVQMMPSMFAFVYPLLSGSCGDTAKYKEQLNGTDEGKIILASVNQGAEMLMKPLLNAVLRKLSGDPLKDFSNDPLLKNLEGLGRYLSAAILNKFLLNLSGNDAKNPLKSLVTNLQNLLGGIYIQNIVPLKKLYQEQIELQKSLEQCDPADAVEIARLKGLLAENKKAKLALLKPVAEALWKAGKLANEPPFNLIPDLALDLIPQALCGAFDSLVKDQPGILKWIDAQSDNAENRTALSEVQNGEIGDALAGMVAPLAVGPARAVLADKSDSIAASAVKGIASALSLDDDLKACLQTVISEKLKDISQTNPLWQFAQENIEGLILELFKGLTSKQAALGKAIFKMVAGKTSKDDFNPLETIAGELLDQAEKFQTAHGAALDKNYASGLAAIRLARAEVDKALAALPALPSNAEKDAIKAKKKALNLMEADFYKQFQPLVDGIITSIGLDTLLAKDGRLGIFGLDIVIREQLLVLCADVYHQAINPLKEKAAINHNLSIALFDASHAAQIALGKDAKAEKLRKAGIALDGADVARQKEILDASDASETTVFVEQLNEMLAGIIENETQKYLITGGEDLSSELNNEVFQKALDAKALKILGDGIQNLSKGNSKGTRAVFQYLHAILVPALNKGLINLLKSTPEAVQPAKGEFEKQMMPVNIILRWFETMHKEVGELENDKQLAPLRDQIWAQEALIKKQKAAIEQANASGANPANLKPLEDELAALKSKLGELNSKMGVLFQPMTKKLLDSVSTGVDVSKPEHPLHDAAFLPEKTRNAIWNVLIPKCLGIFLASHYHKMNPKKEDLQAQLRAITGDNRLNEFCEYMSIVTRDATPDSLTVNPKQLASDLTGTLMNAFAKAPSGAPDYIKKLHEMMSAHEGTVKKVLGSIFNAVGSSKIDVFRYKLWPALQAYTLPALLKLVTKVAAKLKEVDNAPTRTKLTIDFLKLLNMHAKTANNAATATKHAHPHEVPAEAMFDQFRKAGQLHPVIDQVMKASPEEESAIRKAHFTAFGKEFFAAIGFTADDLPLEEAEKAAAFKLLVDELAPLTLELTFDSLAPGKTRNAIGGDLYNSMVIMLLDEYKKQSEMAKVQPQKDLSTIDGTVPGMLDLINSKSKTKEDADQERLDEELGNLVVNEIRARIPDAIAHEQLIIRPLLAASAKDLGRIIREKWCVEGTLVGTLSWLGAVTIQSLFKGKYDDKLDKFIPEQRSPEFHPVSSSAEKIAKTAKDARNQATKVASNLIISGTAEWFNGILDSIALALNTGLRDLYKFIDKVSKARKISNSIINGVKNVVWFLGWALFYVTIIPWVVSLIAKHVYIPARVGANVKNIQKEMHGTYNRNFFYHTTDLMLGKPQAAAAVAPAAA